MSLMISYLSEHHVLYKKAAPVSMGQHAHLDPDGLRASDGGHLLGT